MTAKPETCDARVQTIGPRSKAYYESVPPKVDTGLVKRSESEEHQNQQSFSIKTCTIEASKQINENERPKRATSTPKKARRKSA